MTERGKICVAATADDAAGIARMVQPVLDIADVVEVRLDGMREPQVEKCCILIRKPLLFTNRPKWEGGVFAGSEAQRVEPLLEAIRLQAAYVDLELKADPALRNRLLDALQHSPTRLILSSHDFSATPSAEELRNILLTMIKSGAHIGKIITTAHSPADVLRVLSLQQEAEKHTFPLCTFCMGEAGRISRFATLYLGDYMSYAAVDEQQATAPGQLSVGRMHDMLSLFEASLDN
ncbi:MAG: type I 3-dehydroquinate dehydratase [Desulfobulbaceae bacterium]|nr:type I 3-dehydroquinate dehydratase [Desulfobulbaceae bacterium]